MTNNNIQIELKNAEDIVKKLQQISHKVENKTDLMRTLAGTMHSAVLQNFDASGRPAWQGLKYRQGKPLLNTGALRSSITQSYDNDSAVVGTNMIYAAIHNFGGTIYPKKAKALYIPTPNGLRAVKKVTIPQREFMSLTDQDYEDLADDIQTYFQRIME